MGYRVFTDSCSDLPQSYGKERHFDIIPMIYRIDDTDYLDDGSMSSHEYYEKIRGGSWSTTAQITSARFEEIFAPVLEGGEDILYIAFSSALSGTYHSGMVAKEELEAKFPGRKVLVADSKCASMGEGLLVEYVLNNRDAGMSLEENFDWVEKNKGRFCHWFTVADLNHLKRGGRVSAAAAFLGTMLSIKPVLHVDDEGRLIPMEKAKGRAKSIRALLEHMKATAIEPEKQVIFISHGDAPEEAEGLAQMVRNTFGCKEVRVGNIGPVIGAHSGPGTIALFFVGSPR